MDALPAPLRLALALLLGLYLGWESVSSLRSGVFRYRGRRHLRSEEPKTFWMGVIWFGLLATVMLGYAVLMVLPFFRGAE